MANWPESRALTMLAFVLLHVVISGTSSMGQTDSTDASQVDEMTHEQSDEAVGSLISDLLQDDDNGDFMPGPLMKLAMGIDEPQEFDPAAYIELSDDVKRRLEHTLKRIAAESAGPDVSDSKTNADYPLEVALARGQADLMRAIEPYRTGGETGIGNKPAIRMGFRWSGGSLGADINNYAPDNFEVPEFEVLFELAEEIRRKLEDDAINPRGTPTVDMRELREINVKVLDSYVRALAGVGLARSYGSHKRDEANQECAICRDNPESEPWIRLPCGHAYHTDCTVRWARAQEARANTCPECRRPFRLPFGLYEL